MRLYALYHLNRKILIMMMTCFLIASAASAAIMGKALSTMTVTSQVLPGHTTFCVPSRLPSYFYAFWIPLLAFEALMCGMALYRGFTTLDTEGSLFQSGRQLVRMLIRDSVFYFLAMFTTYLTNLIVWVSARQTLLEIPIGFSVALSSVLASRLVLNVREASRDLGFSNALVNTRQMGAVHMISRSAVVIDGPQRSLTALEMTELRSFRAPRSFRPSMTV